MQTHVAELRLAQESDSLPADMRECPSFPRDGRQVHEPGEKGTASRSGSSDGRFVILELIATGGFAAVYKADSRGQPRPTTLANFGQSRPISTQLGLPA